jgi:O-antigen ligase
MTSLSPSDSQKKIIFNIILLVWILSIPFKNTIYQTSVILLVIFFITDTFNSKKFDILIASLKEIKLLALSFFLIIFSMVLANLLNPEYLDQKSWLLIFKFSIRYALVFVILAYYYKLGYFLKSDLIITLYLSFSFLALTGIFSLISMPEIMLREGLKGTLDNRNAFGLFMGMGFVLSLLLFETRKALSFILMIVFSSLMFFTFSRSSWVASFLASLVFFSLNYKKVKIHHFSYLFVFFIFILIFYFSFESIQHRLSQLLAGDSSGRLSIWTHTLSLIQEKIYFGYGIGTWMNLSDPFLKQYPDPHNMVLEILLYTGVLGLISVFLGVASVLFEIYRQKNYRLFAVAVYFLVVTQFDFGAFGSKELLSFLTIFVFFVYSNKFKPTQACS